MEAGLAFLRNTVCVIRPAITVPIIPIHAATLDPPVAQIAGLRKASFILGCMFSLFRSGLF